MNKKEIFKVITFQLLFSILSGLAIGILSSSDFLMKEEIIRVITYSVISLVLIVVYIWMIKKFLLKFSEKIILRSSLIILFSNLILIISGFLIMKLGSDISAENGQVPIIIAIFLNYGFIIFIPIIELFKLPQILELLIFGSISPLFLYLANKIVNR